MTTHYHDKPELLSVLISIKTDQSQPLIEVHTRSHFWLGKVCVSAVSRVEFPVRLRQKLWVRLINHHLQKVCIAFNIFKNTETGTVDSSRWHWVHRVPNRSISVTTVETQMRQFADLPDWMTLSAWVCHRLYTLQEQEKFYWQVLCIEPLLHRE